MTSSSDLVSKAALGAAVRRHRSARNWSQSTLAARAHYGEGGNVSISKIEAGKTRPSDERLDSIATAFDMTRDELLAEARAIEAATPKGASRDEEGLTLRSVREAFVGSQKVQNEHREGRIAAAVESLRTEHDEHAEDLRRAVDRAREKFIIPFFQLAVQVEGLPKQPRQLLSTASGGEDLHAELQNNQAKVRQSMVDMIGTGAAAGGAGAAAGAAAAFATYAAVGALATASTGTAIAGLSGAAATSATLAWLGGGSLAAGGLGVAGGTALMTGILILPAALAFGAALIYKGRKIRQQSAQEAKALDEAERNLAQTRARFEEAWNWADEASQTLTDATLAGATRLGELGTFLPENHALIKYLHLAERARELLDECLDLAAVILSVQALPIWSLASQVDGHGQSPEAVRGVRDWNDHSLVAAASRVRAIDEGLTHQEPPGDSR